MNFFTVVDDQVLNILRASRKKHLELQAHKAKTSSVTHHFSAVFIFLYMAANCARFEKNVDSTVLFKGITLKLKKNKNS